MSSNNSENNPDMINDTINITGTQTTDYLYALFTNPSLLITLSVIVIIFYLLFSSLGNLTNEESQQSVGGLAFIELLLWGTFFLLIFINSAVYFFEFDITAGINNLFSNEPQVDLNVTTPYSSELGIDNKNGSGDSSDNDSGSGSGSGSGSDGSGDSGGNEVFHVPGNDYAYEDAKAICGAYDARLATYNEVENAYNKGGEWCSYGWSEDQLALYPTQKQTYDELQKIEGHENDCGRPGVNGGYFADPQLKFGVNCFGAKPKIKALEREIMENSEKYPKNLKDIKLEKKTNYWRDNIKNIMLAPFNSTTWSKV